MLKYIRSSFNFWTAVINQFNEDGCTYRAAALAFMSLLAIVPLLAVSFVALKAFPASKTLGLEIQHFIFKNFVASSSQQIEYYLQQFVDHTASLSAIGFIFLIVTAIFLLVTIEQSFNLIWRVKTHRRGMSALLLYWSILTLTPLLLGVGFAMSSYLWSFPMIATTANFLGLTRLLLAGAPFVLSAIAFTVLFVSVPNCSVRFRDGFVGALVAAVLFELAKHGFSLYLSLFPTYELLYGALATVPIFLVWIYLSWLVVLFGAEVSHAMSLPNTKTRKNTS